MEDGPGLCYFAMFDMQEHLRDSSNRALAAINALSDEDILSSNRAEVIGGILDQYRVEPIIFNWEGRFVDPISRVVSSRDFPRMPAVLSGQSARRQTLNYHVPFTGNSRFLMHGTKENASWARRLSIHLEPLSLYFTVVNYADTEDGMKEALAEAETILDQWRSAVTRIAEDVRAHNERLEHEVADAFDRRLAIATERAQRLQLLPVPIRKVSHLKRTFVVPDVPTNVAPVRRTPKTTEPSEWVLDDDVYEHIVALIHDWGTVMERHPSTYAEKDEDALRDFFILLLTPHFQYAGGETFNRAGRSDILIRHKGVNIFIAECKVWHSEGKVTQAIDQLLSYLTWRDTKTALIFFVKTTRIDAACAKVVHAVSSHPCYLRLRANRAKGWYDFEFRVAPSDDRTFRCSVLLFHFPPLQGTLI